LPLPRARALAEAFADRSVDELKAGSWPVDPAGLFAPTGGMPVDKDTIRRLRRELEAIATAAGYPNMGGQAGKSQFDSQVLRLLADFPIAVGEALRAEMWAWVAVVLVPHLVRWRWPVKDEKFRIERFAGPLVRNALGRLWYQGFILDRGKDHVDRWTFSDELTADQVVALLERPSLAASRKTAVAVGKHWAGVPQPRRKEELFRQAMKTLLVRAGVQSLDVLDAESIEKVVDECFSVTMRRLGMS